MTSDKEKQEISVIGRLFSMEIILVMAGVAFLVMAYVREDAMALFWGVMILGGSVALHFVRKKDWKKHWEEQEQMQQIYMEKKRLEQERKEQERKNGERG